MKNKQADNITMSGCGLYSLATRGAKDVIDMAIPRVIAAVESMNLDQPQKNFVLSDTGCADGGTSLELMRSVIARVQQLAPGIHTTIIYVDQPANDFNALVNIVHGNTQFKTWLDEFENVYPLVSATSFYLQCVPATCLDLGFSATAMHWLSRKPGNISDHVHMVGASGEEYKSFARQARQDWQTLLQCRARELKPGGKMVLVNFCRDQAGRYLGNTGGVNMFDTFNHIWQEFLHSGRISEPEYQNMTLPQYYRTAAEFAEPLTDPNNSCHQAGLRLDSMETGVVPCPFAQQFKMDGDAVKFADGLIPTIRSWNQSIFAAGLDQRRPPAERAQIMEDYYRAYYRRVLDNPTGHGMDYVHAYMTISRA